MAGAQLNHSEVNFALNDAKASAPTATPTASMPTATLPTATLPSDPTRTTRTAEVPTATAACGISGLGFEARKPQV